MRFPQNDIFKIGMQHISKNNANTDMKFFLISTLSY